MAADRLFTSVRAFVQRRSPSISTPEFQSKGEPKRAAPPTPTPGRPRNEHRESAIRPRGLNGNVDVEVALEDGSRWGATFFTPLVLK